MLKVTGSAACDRWKVRPQAFGHVMGGQGAVAMEQDDEFLATEADVSYL
jgi:hypothetical protein